MHSKNVQGLDVKQHSPAEIMAITGGTKFDRGTDKSGKPLQIFWRIDKENTFDINGYTLTTDPDSTYGVL